jgi:SAM-dependent methyltransferase
VDNKEVYENFDWSNLKHKDLADKIIKVFDIIPDDVNTIADIGCGNGVITNALNKEYDVTAVDRSAKALEFVNAKKVLASADSIPLPSYQFDMVFSSELLEHLDDKTLAGTVEEIKRLSKKYVLITVPNDENPDKLQIKCKKCGYKYNRPNHLRSFNMDNISEIFSEYKVLKSFTFGKKVRYYNPLLLNIKTSVTPSSAWVPYFWIGKSNRKTICPSCEYEFTNNYKFNIISSFIDTINAVISPKKPYWLFVLMVKR